MASRTASRSAPENRRWLALILVVIFGAFLLRLWNLGTQSLWHDEAWSVMQSYQPLVQLDPNYPPFYTFWLGLWIQVAGDAVWTMRFWSLLVGVVTVALVARIARGWFGARAGLLAALFVAATPILWVYSQEIRSVIAMPLLAVALLAAVEVFLSHPKGEPISRRVWLWLPLIEFISLYTQNLGVPLIAWLNVTVLAALAFRRDWPRLVRWLAVQVGLFVLYLPWLLTQRPTGTPLNTPPPLSLSLPWDIWQSYFTGIKAMLGANRLLMALTALFGAVGLLAVIVALLRWRSRPAWLAFSQLLLLPVFQYGIIRAANVDFHPRYFILAVPATLILMAAGLAAPTSTQPASQPAVGAGPARPMLSRPVRRAAWVGAAVLSLTIMARMAWLTYSSWQFQHDDFRAIAGYYSEHATFWAQIAARPREKLENQRYYAVVVPYGWEPTLDYYRQKADIRLFFIGIPLHSNAETIVERLRSELDDIQEAELLTWYQLPADVRGAYPCLLGTNGEEHESRSLTVNGIQSVNYAWMPGFRSIPAPDTVVAPVATFGEVQLLDARNISGAFGACVMTRWKLPARTGQDWRISVRALNPLGWEIARSDTPLLNDRQLPTSLWTDGETETAFSFLNMPVGTPPYAHYSVTVTLYNEKMPSGVDVIQAGRAIGKSASIGSITRTIFYPWKVAPTNEDIDLGDGLYLHRKDIPSGQLAPGQDIRVTLEWWRRSGTDSLNDHPEDKAEVILAGAGWSVSFAAHVRRDSKALSWHALRIPAAATGKATLKAVAANGKEITLAEYGISPVSRTFSEPSMLLAERPGAGFPGVGTLVGAALPQAPIKAGDPFPITLLWRAEASPTTAYTVFVHLLGADGQIVAQSDAQPAGGARPTTGWLKGEYVVDQHILTFNRPDYRGPATLAVGFYDQATSERVSLKDRTDRFVLQTGLQIR